MYLQSWNRYRKSEKMQKEALAVLLVDYLPNIHNFHLENYNKFPNSYRIVLKDSLAKPDNLVHKTIPIADSICSDWKVMYDRDKESKNSS